MRMTVDDLLIEARGVLPHRPGPAEALTAQAAGALGCGHGRRSTRCMSHTGSRTARTGRDVFRYVIARKRS